MNRRMLICVFTGFSSGLPLYLLIQMVPAWLAVEGVGMAEIGFFSLIQFPYTWKFLWAPLMDRYSLPFLGRRRGWLIVTQVCLLVGIAAMGFVEPQISLWAVAYIAAAVAFFSATQDIVLDAYRRELLPDIELGLGNSIHVQAYRLAGLVPGALGLVMANYFPWRTVFVVVALFMFVGILMTLFIAEAIAEPRKPRTLREAVVEPFREFVTRHGQSTALLILAFLVLYKLGDNMAVALQTAFFVDIGFDTGQIGTIAKFSGLIAAIVGGIVGGVAMIKLGINRALWVFGVVQMISIAGFAVLAHLGPNSLMLGIVVALEYLGVGLGASALAAFMARTTNPAFAATQLALFTALAALPRNVVSAATGVMVEKVGWTSFFIICMVCALPGMLLLFKVAPWSEQAPASTEKVLSE